MTDTEDYIHFASKVAARDTRFGHRMTTMGEISIARAIMEVAKAIREHGKPASTKVPEMPLMMLRKDFTFTATQQTEGVLDDVRRERIRHVTELEYSPEHDDKHKLVRMLGFVHGYMHRAIKEPDDREQVRKDLMKATAVLVATIEKFDREAS